MATQGHTVTLGTHIGIGRATDAKGWYALFKTWLAARHDASLSAMNAHWDARREAVRPYRADAAIDMVAPTHVDTTARALCELSL
jgi:hypothetical protein